MLLLSHVATVVCWYHMLLLSFVGSTCKSKSFMSYNRKHQWQALWVSETYQYHLLASYVTWLTRYTIQQQLIKATRDTQYNNVRDILYRPIQQQLIKAKRDTQGSNYVIYYKDEYNPRYTIQQHETKQKQMQH